MILLVLMMVVGVLIGFGLGVEHRDQQAFVRALNPKERR